MAEYDGKYLDHVGAKYLWDKSKNTFVHKDGDKVLSDNNYTTAEKEKLEGLENYELPVASADTLGGMKIGNGLHIKEDGTVETVYNPEMPVDWDTVENKPSTIEGYGITDAATTADVDAVNNRVDSLESKTSKLYVPKGSVDKVSDLDGIENPEYGWVYNVRENGKNYAWCEGVGENDFWDDLGGTFEIESLTEHDLDIITGSASSEAALKQLLAEGGDIELNSNIALSEPAVITEDTVIDLNGHTLSSAVAGYMLTANGKELEIRNGKVNSTSRLAQAINGGKVTINSGTFSSGDVAFTASGTGSKVTINGGSITAQEGGIGAFDGAELEINDGQIEGIDNFPVFTNGTEGRGGNTITINGGKLIGNITSSNYESCGVYIANNDSFTMNDGSIVSNGGCGILMRAGNVVINGGFITATTGSHVPGYVGDNKTKMSASAVIYHETANYPGKTGMSLVINGGKFVGADHALEVLSNEATPNVTVNGGDFTPAYP